MRLAFSFTSRSTKLIPKCVIILVVSAIVLKHRLVADANEFNLFGLGAMPAPKSRGKVNPNVDAMDF